ncbi:nuclear transport factor 2 family protein [Bradyrhizobium betae]|uniref:nuclear transport factor 2 family protein n=1 Tax=Bradyrhizobium betae TaxID=244734 RepID=UPI0013868CE4|nr:nuclear transport factor 2 family protein [Bradyrhizobium betae]MCS3725200.1 ketosteroid isomerase-like protein [Bradyrhizobium betae]
MTPSHVELAKLFLNILGSGNLSSLKDIFSEDIRIEYPGLRAVAGSGKVVLLLKRIFSQFETLRFEALDFIQDGEKLCVTWKNDGRLKTGDAFRNEGATVLHIRNGAIEYVSDYFKYDRKDTQP